MMVMMIMIMILLQNQTWVHFPCTVKSTYWQWVAVKESVWLMQVQVRSPGQLVLKRCGLAKVFQGKVYKDRMREGGCEVCDQFVDILLIGWWWGNWESTSSAFGFQRIWGLRACGQHIVNFFHLVGVSVSATAPRTWLRMSPIVLEGELMVLNFVEWLNYYYFVLLDCIPFFLRFLSSLIKFILFCKVSLKTKGRQRTLVGVYSGKAS